MLNKKDFREMAREHSRLDDLREGIIKDGRTLLKLSKQIIYAAHREDIKSADAAVREIKTAFKKLDAIVKRDKRLLCVGAFKTAVAEYAEALLYYEFVKNQRIPTRKELGIDSEHYLLGLADLTGELVRKAVFLAGKGNLNDVVVIKDLVDEIYGEMLKFDIHESELRRKFDGIKYNLKEMEDLVLNLKLKGK